MTLFSTFLHYEETLTILGMEPKIQVIWATRNGVMAFFNIPHWLRCHSTNGRLQHIDELSISKTRVGMVRLKLLILGTIDGVLVSYVTIYVKR